MKAVVSQVNVDQAIYMVSQNKAENISYNVVCLVFHETKLYSRNSHFKVVR